MNDPARWRDPNGGADAEARAIVLGDPGPAPSSAEVDRIWSSLEPHLGIGPGPTQAPHTAAGTAALVGKVTLAVVLVAAVGAGVSLQRIHSRDRKDRGIRPEPAKTMSSASPPAATPAASPPGVEVPPPAEIPPAIEAPTRPKARAQRPTHPAANRREAHEVAQTIALPAVVRSSTNELLEEGRRLARARAALRAHDPDRALELLETGARGTAALAQEREALTIEALAGKPDSRATAAERARVFMRTYPESPYRARIKALVLENQ